MRENIQDRIVLTLKEKKEVDLWELSSLGLFNEVIEIVKKMRKNGLVAFDNRKGVIRLTPKGKKVYGDLLNFKIDTKFKRRYQKLREKIATPSFSKNEFDQLPLMTKSIFYQLNFMLNKGDVFNKKIVCIGDDDLFGLCLALTGLPKSILIVDIDKRIIEYEVKSSKKLKVRVRALEHDLRKPIPKHFQKRFDVFLSQPPDTLNGLTLFFSRGCEFLREGGVAYIGLGKCDVSLKTYRKFEERIIKMGFTITEILPSFLTYRISGDELKVWPEVNLPKWTKPPRTQWFRVDLLRAEAFDKIKPMIKGYYRKDILTYTQE